MSLVTRNIAVDGVEYEVHEQPMRVVLPLMETSGTEVLLALMQVAVHQGGAALGDGVLDLGFRAFTQLMTVVKEVNGLGEDAAGNAG